MACRRPLWLDLQLFHSQISDPWLIGGDFNTFLSLEEHKGVSMLALRTLADFNGCVDNCSLLSIPFQGSSFTWCDGHGLGRIWRRLDRFLCSHSIFDMFESVQGSILVVPHWIMRPFI